jgi:hypothetical protein
VLLARLDDGPDEDDDTGTNGFDPDDTEDLLRAIGDEFGIRGSVVGPGNDGME